MIPGWDAALDHAARHLAPGGQLHIVDFGGTTRWPAPARRALHAWLATFSVQPRLDMGSRLAALAEAQGLGLDVQHLYRDYAVRAVLTRS
jgi:S-adenosylmethionine-diacylgycerolhomoserine-N-methlytransferase